MKKRIILVHGWTRRNNMDWFPWAVKEFSRLGYKVIAPAMPNPDYPKVDEWIDRLHITVKEIRQTDIFIGHSIGAMAIKNYLQSLEGGKRVDKVVLVASADNLSEAAIPLPEDKVIYRPWHEALINYKKINKMANKFIAIYSSNDPWVIYEDNYRIPKEKLNAEIVVEQNKGHFMAEDGVTELPVLLKFLSV